jgi:hypothetical protein
MRRLLLGVAITLLGLTASASAHEDPSASPPRAPAPGDVFPDLESRALDGSPQVISFGKATDAKASDTVLLFFLSGCPTCHKMIPEWNRAYERRPRSLRVVGLLMDQEPPGFFEAMGIAFPVARAPGRSVLQSLKVERAPLTLRVGPGGKVKDAALGIVDPIRLGEIFRP